jgi:hypothetical protein
MSNPMSMDARERHDDLHRQVRDALDLAIAGGAPLSLLEKLGACAALLEALAALPRHALVPEVVARAERALAAWQQWRAQSHLTAAA